MDSIDNLDDAMRQIIWNLSKQHICFCLPQVSEIYELTLEGAVKACIDGKFYQICTDCWCQIIES